jgi:chloramphenicol-sensitive protein RarD
MSTLPEDDLHARQDNRTGFLHGLAAYGLWGLLPLYLKLMPNVSPFEIVAHRIVWSVIFLAALLAAMRLYPALTAALRQPRVLGALVVSALLIAINWLTYVWAVAAHHLLAASLGYFLNPLVTVLMGLVFLGEKLRHRQLAAIIIAAIGVAILAMGELQTLWISLTLAVSFAFYALVRKLVVVPPTVGLMVETLVLALPALAALAWYQNEGTLAFGRIPLETALLIGLGAITSVPLILFASAARRLSMVTLGVMQYIAPTCQFLIGFLLFGEPLSPERLASFGLIWIALILFVWDSVRSARNARR